MRCDVSDQLLVVVCGFPSPGLWCRWMSQGCIPRERSLGEMKPLFVRENVIKVEVADDLFYYCKHVTLNVSARKGHAAMKFTATFRIFKSKLIKSSIVVTEDVWKPVK